MKIISVPRINALGLKGPEEMGEKVLAELDVKSEEIKVDNTNIEEAEKIIYDKVKDIFKKEDKFIFIGGDHSITYPIFKAFSESKKNSFLIVFDAHADCDYPAKDPTHEEFLRAILEEELVKPENVVLIGVRKMWDIEKEFLKEKGIKIFEDISDIEAVANYITEKSNGKDVYVSIDIDVLDPTFAPAVNYPEPNGLSSKELFYLLERISHIKNLKVLDIVEAVPEKDKKYDYKTVKICAKIIKEFIKISR
jgi:agmatinase